MGNSFENKDITFLSRNEPIKCPETIRTAAGAEGNRKGSLATFASVLCLPPMYVQPRPELGGTAAAPDPAPVFLPVVKLQT